MVDADFYQSFTLGADLPGASKLRIEVWDFDLLTQDDLIGATEIDLEERVFNPITVRSSTSHRLSIASSMAIPRGSRRARSRFGSTSCARRTSGIHQRAMPRQRRAGAAQAAAASQGRAAQARPEHPREISFGASSAEETAPLVAVTTPSKASARSIGSRLNGTSRRLRRRSGELRVIVWAARDVKCQDVDLAGDNMNDLYCVAQYANGAKQETDTHWRARGGEAQWNWRLTFPVVLGHARKPTERFRSSCGIRT